MIRRCLLTLALVLALVPLAQAQSTSVVLQSPQVSGIANATTTRNTVVVSTLGTTSIEILINIFGSGTATGTLQIWLEDSVDGGTTWDDLVSSNTFALGATAITQRFFVSGLMIPSSITSATSTNLTQGTAAAVETMAAATARQGPWGDRIRVREKISSASGSPVGASYAISAVFR